MRKIETHKVEIIEDVPEQPGPHDHAYRLIKFEDGSYEFYVAEFVIEEITPADFTSGPQASIELDDWKHVESGFGHADLDELIARFHEPWSEEDPRCYE